MTRANVLHEVNEGVAVLTLNNVENHNALTVAMTNDLIGILEGLANSNSVSVVVLTGAGERAFSAGVDLKELSRGEGLTMDEHENQLGVDAPLVRAFAALPQPLIGAVNGFAVTGGFELALACDFLVCSENARFADTHALVGLLPGWGLSQKLPRLIGVNRAMEWAFTGRYIDAEEAHKVGLVNHIYSSSSLMPEVIEMAKRIAQADPQALPRIKKMTLDGWQMPLGDALRMEGEVAMAYNGSVDFSYLEQRLELLRKLAKS